MPQTRVLVAVGSNISPEANIPRAVRLLAVSERVVAVSRFYRTPPIGRPDDPEFVNGAVALMTDRSARDLKYGVLRAVESAVGRVRLADAYAPRPIDLDIMLYGDAVIDEPGLRVPDPDLTVRPFLAYPVLEIAPTVCMPGVGRPLGELVSGLDRSQMRYDPGVSSKLTIRSLE